MIYNTTQKPLTKGATMYHSKSLWLILLILLMGQPTFAQLPASIGGQALPSLAPMLEKVLPAVVNISSSTRTRVKSPLFNDPFFRHFFGVPEQQQEKQSRGSGVIINARKGYVVTNHHVVEDAYEVSITLRDGRQVKAEVIGTDSETDVALLKIPTQGLTDLSLANSDQLRVGDFVVAIGNPFGLGQTVTSGIVSALGRTGLGIEGYEDFIQTDASINPGNSGGALVNLRGELVGLNTAIFAPSGGNVGIGFAIPSNMMDQVIQHLVQFGEVRRGHLGVHIQDLTPDLAAAFGLGSNSNGAVVVKVEPGSPAQKASLTSGDIITAIDDKAVKSASDLRNRIGLLRIGEQVKITVMRKGYSRNLYATIADTKQVEGGKLSVYLKGAILKDHTQGGVQIYQLEQDSNADKIGLRKDDIIIGLNRQVEVKDLAELTQYFRQYQPNSIQVRRQDEIWSIRLK
jgi:Do/DeqQ family serine protease